MSQKHPNGQLSNHIMELESKLPRYIVKTKDGFGSSNGSEKNEGSSADERSVSNGICQGTIGT